MAEAKKKMPLFTTNRGVFSFPHLNKPDTKFDADGVYKTNLIQPTPKSQGLTDTVDAALDEAFERKKAELREKGEGAKLKKLKKAYPYADECDKEGDATGKTVIRFKVNAVGKNPKTGEEWSNAPAIFDASGQPLDKAVYSGSEGKISYQIIPYFNAKDVEVGVTLRLKAVQVLKLISSGPKGASGYGFTSEDADEDDVGYDEDTTSEAATSSADDASEDEDDVDF